MKYLKSILLTISFIIFGIGALILGYIIFPLAKLFYKDDDYIIFASNANRIGWKIFIKYMEIIRLIKVNIKDIEKLKNIKNKVIVATHPSFIDILILMSNIKKSTCFVKKSLTVNPILKNIVNTIFIPNNLEVDKLNNEAQKYLEKGFNVIIFPAGTRHRKNEHPKIKKGASLIATIANKDIVPIKITTSEDFLFINQPFYKIGNKTVQFDIEVLDTIEIKKFYNESDIIMKRNITNEITNILYN